MLLRDLLLLSCVLAGSPHLKASHKFARRRLSPLTHQAWGNRGASEDLLVIVCLVCRGLGVEVNQKLQEGVLRTEQGCARRVCEQRV